MMSQIIPGAGRSVWYMSGAFDVSDDLSDDLSDEVLLTHLTNTFIYEFYITILVCLQRFLKT